LIRKAFENNGACTLPISVKVLDNARRSAIVVAESLMEPKDHAWEVQNRESAEWPPSPSRRVVPGIYAADR
jgi:hypothetical protein